MPSSTFFRLPEEKRQRLTDAAWAEFTRTGFSDASINKIICRARIPRGSFYQYFSDKEDLFRYLLEGTREHYIEVINAMLEENHGDLFALPLAAFDRFARPRENTEQRLDRFVRLIGLNRGMDMQQLFLNQQEILPDSVWEHIDRARLRRQDRTFAEQVFALLLACTGAAVIDSITRPEHRARQRDILCDRVEVLAYGSLKPELLPQQGGNRA